MSARGSQIYYELDRDVHRARAYDGAAKSIEAAHAVHRLLDEGRLEELSGIGPSTARVIGELARRGTADVLESMRARWPAVMLDLARLPKIGVNKARAIVDAFQPADLEAVAALCRAGALHELRQIGKVTEAAILRAIETREVTATHAALVDAEERADAMLGALRASLRDRARRARGTGAPLVRGHRSPRLCDREPTIARRR